MKSLVFLLEEPSARDLIEGLLPRLLPDAIGELAVTFMVFEGKQDLENNLVRRIRGWLVPDTRFVVLRDQDSADCHAVKSALVERTTRAGRPDAVVRVACRDLECWVLGDLAALGEEFGKPAIAAMSQKQKFRDPDQLSGAVTEIRSLVGAYQKRDGARRMGPRLDPERNTSRSFRVFCAGVRRAVVDGPS